jgi:hypothetical protein
VNLRGLWPERPCPTHDRPAPATIRYLEAELGLDPSPAEGDLVDQYANPGLIDCGQRRCRSRQGKH